MKAAKWMFAALSTATLFACGVATSNSGAGPNCTTCPAGQMCSGGVCVDECAVASVAAACASAATHASDCCGRAKTGDQLCHAEIAAGRDPATSCGTVAGASCETLHATLLTAGICCCPSGKTCDPEQSHACVASCTSKADCAASNNTCAPTAITDSVVPGGWVCRPHDGKAWHGCIYDSHIFSADEVYCAQGYECWARSASDGWSGGFCTLACSAAADCGSSSASCGGTCEQGHYHSDGTVYTCANGGGCIPGM